MTQAIFDARPAVGFMPERPLALTAFPPVASGDIAVSVACDFSSLQRDWRAFEQVADGTVFQTFDFVSAYCRTIGAAAGVQPAIVIGRERNGTMLFLFPLAIDGRASVRRLTWLGSEICDYNGPLLAPNFSAQIDGARFRQIWQSITARLQADPALRHDIVDLEGMPGTVGSQVNPFVHLGVDLHPSHAYLTPMSGGWEKFYRDKRSSSARKRDRYRRKKLGELGVIRLVTPDRDPDITATIDLLIAQKSAAFAAMGVANLFDRPGYRDFFHELATNADSRALVHVSRLAVGRVDGAVNLGLLFRGRYYHVLTSYDPGETARIGAGAVHLQDLMRYAMDQGCTLFDFTVGDEAYKREWCDSAAALYDHLAAAGLKGALAVALTRTKRRLKRTIKQSPALWSAFFKLRKAISARPPA